MVGDIQEFRLSELNVSIASEQADVGTPAAGFTSGNTNLKGHCVASLVVYSQKMP